MLQKCDAFIIGVILSAPVLLAVFPLSIFPLSQSVNMIIAVPVALLFAVVQIKRRTSMRGIPATVASASPPSYLNRLLDLHAKAEKYRNSDAPITMVELQNLNRIVGYYQLLPVLIVAVLPDHLLVRSLAVIVMTYAELTIHGTQRLISQKQLANTFSEMHSPTELGNRVLAPSNLFALLQHKITNATESQFKDWEPKVSALERVDEERDYPLAGVSQHLIRDLRDYVAAKHPTWTMREFQAKYVMTVASRFKCSLLNLMQVVLNIECRQSTVFVSHAWKYNNNRFFSCLVDLDSYANEWFWIDSLTVNQFAAQRGFIWWSTTFLKCIEAIGKTLLVLAPYSDPVPLTRAWCLFEIYCTHQAGNTFDIALDKLEIDAFVSALKAGTFEFEKWIENLTLGRADAFDERDRICILAIVKRDVEGGIAKLDKQVMSMLRNWLSEQIQTLSASPIDIQDTNPIRAFVTLYALGNNAKIASVDTSQHVQQVTDLESFTVALKLGLVCAVKCHHKKAEAHFRQCFLFCEREPSVATKTRFMAVFELGVVLTRVGKNVEAVVILRPEFLRLQATLGDTHEYTMQVRFALAAALLAESQIEETEQVLRTSLELPRNQLLACAPRGLFLVLGQFCSAAGKPSEAESFLRMGLDMAERHFGGIHDSTNAFLIPLADVLYRNNKLGEAEQLSRRCVANTAILRRQGFLETRHDIMSAELLASILFSKGELVEAETHFRSALAIVSSKPENEVVFDEWRFVARFAAFLRDTGRVDEAIPLCRKALRGLRRSGGNHALTQEVVELMNRLEELAAANSDTTATAPPTEQ